MDIIKSIQTEQNLLSFVNTVCIDELVTLKNELDNIYYNSGDSDIEDWKYDVLTDIYNTINIAQCIIYINSKNKLNDVYQCLLDDNFPVGMIHGSLMTNERSEIMEKFRDFSR